MKTIILPGYSEHNRVWAEEIAEKLTANGLQTTVHYWRHWPSTSPSATSSGSSDSGSSSGSFSLKYEIKKILEEVGKEEKINIIAKSVGVYVALNLIPRITSQVKKVILCGIASVAGEDRKGLVKTVLSKIPTENILCIQNENDKFVPFVEAEKFYHSVEPKLKVISKPRSDHHYPYLEDFQNFLAG